MLHMSFKTISTNALTKLLDVDSQQAVNDAVYSTRWRGD